MSNAEPRWTSSSNGPSVRAQHLLAEVRHWGCIRACAKLANGQIKARDFEHTYIAEMERIWSLNEDRLHSLRRIRAAGEDREFWADFEQARELARRSDAALFTDLILRP